MKLLISLAVLTQIALGSLTYVDFGIFVGQAGKDGCKIADNVFGVQRALVGDCISDTGTVITVNGVTSRAFKVNCGSVVGYENSGCTGATQNIGASCTDTTGLGLLYINSECKNTETLVTYETFSDANCTSNATTSLLLPGGCQVLQSIGTTILETGDVSVNGNDITVKVGNNADCVGNSQQQNLTSGECVAGTKATKLTETPGGATAPCFHRDTKINYKGEEFTFDQIKEHPECNIPHVVTDQGVVIQAQCGNDARTLRLTDGHLVFTNSGMKAASELEAGVDRLFSDVGETQECTVTSVKKELKSETYFGLNCYTSEVLADGLKSSTFEKLHWLPSAWMEYAGQAIGIKYASIIGEKIQDIALAVFPNIEVLRF